MVSEMLQKEPVFWGMERGFFGQFCLPAACGAFREAQLSASHHPHGMRNELF